MNMDYSKAFELLNQDAEKERNKKAEKAVHNNLYNKGFRDGLAVLGKIRAEIEAIIGEHNWDDYDFCSGLICARKIIDKYKAESEE